MSKSCKNCIFYNIVDEYCRYFADFLSEKIAKICEYYKEK